MAYSAATRLWYGPESYQNALYLKPAAHTPGTTPALPCIVYRPGGGWAGADVADLASRGWWTYGLNDATNATHVDTYVVFVVQTASVGYNRTQQVGLTAWVDATAYTLGLYRSHGGRLWVCIDAHTSNLANDAPGAGTNWDDFWREVGINETGVRKVADLGELTPGGLDESVLNVQQCIAHIRRNAHVYGIDPDQVCVAGASSGGQLAGCAAYAEDLAWARRDQIHAASRRVPYTLTRPNAALLSITPVDLTRHTAFGLLNGLYGEDVADADWIDADLEWKANGAAVQRAMSPLFVMERTGLAVPTCLEFLGQGSHTTNFSGLTGSPYHHPDNGWLMLQALNAAPPTGLGQSGHIFFDDASAGVYRYYTAFPVTGAGSPTSAGTSGDPRVAASLILAWLNDAMDV